MPAPGEAAQRRPKLRWLLWLADGEAYCRQRSGGRAA
jgi:hypothetical protein